MPYKPQTTQGLILELGTVYGCTMTAGTKVCTLSAPPPGMNSSWVGYTVTIIGAGVTTGDPYTAALFRSTIRSVDSTTQITLVDEAVTTVSPNFNCTIYRPLNTQADVLERSPIDYDKSLSTGTATLNFSVWSKDGSVRPAVDQPVWLHHTTLGDLFGGFISITDPRNEPGTAGLETACQCIDWSGILIRRLIGTANSTYTSLALNAICESLVYNHAGSEGFIVNAVTGPTIAAASYDYTNTVADGLTDLCGKASGPSGSFWWYVDAWKTIYVVAQDTTSAPFHMRDTDGSAQFYWLAQIKANVDATKRANRVYASGQELQATTGVTFLGDGTTTKFTMPLPVGAVSLIAMDAIDQTYAIKGSINPATGLPYVAQWYWTVGSTTIEQDPSGAPVATGHFLHVSYQAILDISDFYSYGAGVDEVAAMAGGTGYIDIKVDVPGVQPVEGTIASFAENVAQNMAGLPATIEGDTYCGGLDVAQLMQVELAYFGLPNTDYLIDEIKLNCADNLMLWTAHMVAGPLIGDWRNAFLNLAGGGGGGSISSGGGGGGGGGGSSAPVADIVTVITADTTLGAFPEIVQIDSTAGDVTATLPSATLMVGQHKVLWKSATAHNAVVHGSGSETIDGAPSYTMTAAYQGVMIESISATAWKIVAEAVSAVASGPTAPGTFTITNVTAKWVVALAS